MTDKLLFGVIGLLMLAILGVAGFAVLNNGTTENFSAAQQNPNVPTSTSGSVSAGTYTMAQVAQHASATSCFTAISGSVYNLTSFINQHPGGAQAILSLCGRDGTAAFMAQHGGQGSPERELAALKIGVLAK
jgi:cytochrome b involved in lipid metabolism